MKNVAPKPGDLTVCRFCAAVLVYRRDLRVRMMTDREAMVLGRTEPETLQKILRTVANITHINFVERSMQVN